MMQCKHVPLLCSDEFDSRYKLKFVVVVLTDMLVFCQMTRLYIPKAKTHFSIPSLSRWSYLQECVLCYTDMPSMLGILMSIHALVLVTRLIQVIVYCSKKFCEVLNEKVI